MNLADAINDWNKRCLSATGYKGALQELSIDIGGAEYVAEQRALRLVLSMSGQPEPRTRAVVKVDDPGLLRLGAMLWLDGLGCAAEQAQGPRQEIGKDRLAQASRRLSELSEGRESGKDTLRSVGCPYRMPELLQLGMGRASVYASSPPISHQPRRGTGMQTLMAIAACWAEGAVIGWMVCQPQQQSA